MNIDGYCTLGVDREFDLTEADLLRSMDATGVDRALIVPPDRFQAVLNREGNDCMLTSARHHPDRFIVTCSVSPWYGDSAIEELRRCLAEGARMLVLNPLVQGYQANDELVWPVLDAALPENIPVYVHTGPPGNSTPWQVVDLAERYPGIDFILGHCGTTDFWADVVPSCKAVGNLYLESSLSRPFSFSNYISEIGQERAIVSSGAPLTDMGFEWEQMRTHLPPAEYGSIYGENLRGLLEKRGAL